MGRASWNITHGKTGNFLEFFPLVNNLFHSKTINSKHFGNGLRTLTRLMGSNNSFSKIIADAFPPWHCVKTHQEAPDQQTEKALAL